MTDPAAAWDANGDPAALAAEVAWRLTDRQWRLFHCGCVRRVWHLLDDVRLRTAIEAAELHADGLLDTREYGRAVTDANRARRRHGRADWAAYQAARYIPGQVTHDTTSILGDCQDAASQLAEWEQPDPQYTYTVIIGFDVTDPSNPVPSPSPWPSPPPQLLPPGPPNCSDRRVSDPSLAAAEARAQAAVLRDIAGNPYRPRPADRPWATPAVAAVAADLYAAADFGRVRPLGEALHAAGSDDAELLAHCFAPHQHVRGCWAVDAVRAGGDRR